MSNRVEKKHNKKEEQKTLVVRIVCIVLVGALLLTSLVSLLNIF